MNLRPAIVVVLVLGLSVVVDPRLAYAAPPPAVCSSGVAGDVNGDGFAEVAVGESGNDSNDGQVHVFYGTASGLTASAHGSARDDQVFGQSTPGVPGDPAAGGFGATTAFGDFNSDGCADLAVGAPDEDNLDGSVTVLYGSPAGLSVEGAQRFTTESVFGITKDDRCNKVYEEDDEFFDYECEQLGAVLSVGDLDGDGDDDLVASAPQLRSGAVEVFPGSPSGLKPAGATLLRGDDLGFAGFDGFLQAMTVGNVDGSGADELIVGAFPDSVLVISGSGPDLVPTTSRRYTPATPGVPGDADIDFGDALASGDVNGDGRDDVAVGSLYDDAVTLLLGGPHGLTGTGSQRWTSKSPGVAAVGAREFGQMMSIADLDGDRRADLVVGAPGDTVGGKTFAGSVTVLRGSAKGLTTAGFGGRIFTQNTPGIADAASSWERFGAQLTTAYVRGGGRATILIGVPAEKRGSHRDAGLLHELGVSKTGPTARGSVAWDLARPGVKGRQTDYSGFGMLNGPVE